MTTPVTMDIALMPDCSVPQLQEGTPTKVTAQPVLKTPLSSLYEICSKKRLVPPVFTVGESVRGRFRIFNCKVKVKTAHNKLEATGSGSTKKGAKHDAAKAVLSQLEMKELAEESLEFLKLDLHVSANSVVKLQRACAQLKWMAPKYSVVSETDKPHQKIFVVACTSVKNDNHILEIGMGRSKKLARNVAAFKLHKRILNLLTHEQEVALLQAKNSAKKHIDDGAFKVAKENERKLLNCSNEYSGESDLPTFPLKKDQIQIRRIESESSRDWLSLPREYIKRSSAAEKIKAHTTPTHVPHTNRENVIDSISKLHPAEKVKEPMSVLEETQTQLREHKLAEQLDKGSSGSTVKSVKREVKPKSLLLSNLRRDKRKRVSPRNPENDELTQLLGKSKHSFSSRSYAARTSAPKQQDDESKLGMPQQKLMPNIDVKPECNRLSPPSTPNLAVTTVLNEMEFSATPYFFASHVKVEADSEEEEKDDSDTFLSDLKIMNVFSLP